MLPPSLRPELCPRALVLRRLRNPPLGSVAQQLFARANQPRGV